jgi:predicted site-specific integrase-resolvase
VTPVLVSQRTFADEIGISVTTFKKWLASGRIPEPLLLPGWPRWSRTVVNRVKAEIAQSGEGRYFRAAQTRRRKGGFQSRTSRLQQCQGTRHTAHVAGESVGNLHDANHGAADSGGHLHSLERAR